MKNLKKWKYLFLLFILVLTIESCRSDDEIIRPANATDSNNSNNNNNNNNSTNNPEGAQGDITLYAVEGSNIVKKQDYKVSGKELELQKDTKKHQEIWALTKNIIPKSYLSKMSEFMIYAGEENGTAGYVFNTAQDLSKWQMGIAIDFAYQGGFNAGGELAYTIVHEFGHILTLDNTQLDASISESACENYFVGEGCAKTTAYINKTYNIGWADIWKEYQSAQESESAMQQFYEKYRSRFSTGYASTNPAEDIAEVFATFVTRNGGVNGSSIAEKKIQIMYDHNELTVLRNYIRNNRSKSKSSTNFLPVTGSWKRASTIGNPRNSSCLTRMK